MPDFMLTIHTQRHRYAVVHQQEIEVRHIAGQGGLGATDRRSFPLHSADLGTLLDPEDQSVRGRRCAFVVPLRRRSVALLCDAVDELRAFDPTVRVPLPFLLRSRLKHAWIDGMYLEHDAPILILDLRQIAVDVLRQPIISQGEPA